MKNLIIITILITVIGCASTGQNQTWFQRHPKLTYTGEFLLYMMGEMNKGMAIQEQKRKQQRQQQYTKWILQNQEEILDQLENQQRVLRDLER